jgi:hypothetical protein
MPLLLFKHEFFDAIRTGRKTTTLRRWKSCKMNVGDLATCPGFGKLRINECSPIKLGKLKESDAVADGFESLADLLRTLKRLYPDQKTDGKQWYRVGFTLESIASPPKTKKKSAGKTGKSVKPIPPADKARLARRIRAELDKAVQRNGLLSSL